MTERITPARTCGIVGGILFAAVAAYNLYLYIMLLMGEGASLNFMTLLTVAESAAIGVLAVLNKRGRLLVAVNPGREELKLELDGAYAPIYTLGNSRTGEKTLILGSQSFAILAPAE